MGMVEKAIHQALKNKSFYLPLLLKIEAIEAH